MFEDYGTDKNLEREGVWLRYPSFRVLCARAGGSNKKYLKLMERRTKAHQAQIRTDNFSNEQAQEVLKDVYSDSVILDWQVLSRSSLTSKEPSSPMTATSG